MLHLDDGGRQPPAAIHRSRRRIVAPVGQHPGAVKTGVVHAFTIENVEPIDGERIIVGNDNNLPFSSGRALGKADDNELVILRVPELLKAK